ncbi:MAG TPA: hypothetical protein VJN43_02950 [Bryobacteraceae bacterium]|nr:hypothetical protein [Bryobacteraceae bacterium]
MALRLDLRENFFDFPVPADHKSGALDAHHFLTVHVLLFQDAISRSSFLVDVAKQRERQLVLGLEARLRGRGVGRDTDDRCPLLFKLLDGVTKLVRFGSSTGRIGAREKIKHDPVFHPGELKRFVSVGL